MLKFNNLTIRCELNEDEISNACERLNITSTDDIKMALFTCEGYLFIVHNNGEMNIRFLSSEDLNEIFDLGVKKHIK